MLSVKQLVYIWRYINCLVSILLCLVETSELLGVAGFSCHTLEMLVFEFGSICLSNILLN